MEAASFANETESVVARFIKNKKKKQKNKTKNKKTKKKRKRNENYGTIPSKDERGNRGIQQEHPEIMAKMTETYRDWHEKYHML